MEIPQKRKQLKPKEAVKPEFSTPFYQRQINLWKSDNTNERGLGY